MDIFLIFAIMVLGPVNKAKGYKFQILDYPNAELTQLNGINDYGVIVGTFSSGNGFIYDSGKFDNFHYMTERILPFSIFQEVPVFFSTI